MATRTISNAGGNWSSTATWVEGAVPTIFDVVVATSGSGSVLIDTPGAICNSGNFNNYTGILTFGSGNILSVEGNLNLVSNMSLTGPGTLNLLGSGNSNHVTSAGNTIPGNLILNGNIQFNDNWIVNGFTTQSAVTTGNSLTCNGGINLAANTSASTTNIIVAGGTLTGIFNSEFATIFINSSGTVTIGALQLFCQVPNPTVSTLTYISGNVNCIGTLTLGNSTNIHEGATLNTAGILWNNVVVQTNTTSFPTLASTVPLNLLSNFNIAGMLSLPYALQSGQPATGLAISGAYNTTCGVLSINTGSTLTIQHGQTLAVTDAIYMIGNDIISAIIESSQSSSPAYLSFTGSPIGDRVFMSSFTDIDASSSTQPILNYFGSNPGGTLTRTENIINFNLPATTAHTSDG